MVSIRYNGKELSDRQKSNLGNVLRRIANAYHDLVSDPSTLSTAIGVGKGTWKMEDVEKKLLEDALRLVSLDRTLQKSAGNVRERIQSEVWGAPLKVDSKLTTSCQNKRVIK